MIAAAMLPLLAMIGGAVDMGRGYLVETRLQAACDAGVLAARKRMGTRPATGGEIPADVAETGRRFFNVNFRSGDYATDERTFELTVEPDFSLSGQATAKVPTTIMGVFGYDNLNSTVKCGAQVNLGNIDVMMVLDVTGSMNETRSGDANPKIVELKTTVRSFYDQLQTAKSPTSRIRYGFVPYATNVNSGSLLNNNWVASNWTYQSRVQVGTGTAAGTVTYWAAGSPLSGTVDRTAYSTYPATTSGGSGLNCPTVPASTRTATTVQGATTTEPYPGPPVGTLTRTNYRYTYNGDTFDAVLTGSTCTVYRNHYITYLISYDLITQPGVASSSKWQYRPISYDVSAWRSETAGCMEEPDTYEIDDYDNIDLTRAIDLDVDHVPSIGVSSTQWRPMYPGRVYGRALKWNGSGSFNPAITTTTDEYLTPSLAGTAGCPNPARKLAEMTPTQVDSYLATLKVGGSTYHDIGMLWGVRLLSPAGLFASENIDISAARPTNRHLVFMTDGQTSTLDISYSAYGLEPLDRRRWTPGSGRTLTQTVEDRFLFLCGEAKKRNISIWLVAYGTELSDTMNECAGPGHAFQADSADELADRFATIANTIADLRISS